MSGLCGLKHGTASITRPTVSVQPDNIDIACARSYSFFENSGAFVDHRVQDAHEYFVITDCSPLEATTGTRVGDELFHVGIRQRRRRALLVPVVAFTSLLAKPPCFAQLILDLRHLAAVQARAPTNIKSGQI